MFDSNFVQNDFFYQYGGSIVSVRLLLMHEHNQKLIYLRCNIMQENRCVGRWVLLRRIGSSAAQDLKQRFLKEKRKRLKATPRWTMEGAQQPAVARREYP